MRLKATKTIAAATLRVVPSLAQYVTVSPGTITNLAKGQNLEVTVTLSLPIDSSAESINGTIQLRSSDKGTIPKPLPVLLSVVCPCLPPDPGVTGLATLEGIDSNEDGIRDDLERYIALNYRGSENMNVRLALLQFTSVLQSTFGARFLESTAHELVPTINRATECLRTVHSDDASRSLILLENRFTNTPERLIAYGQFNSQLEGGYFAANTDDLGAQACAFAVN
jgi:hypothetical protein